MKPFNYVTVRHTTWSHRRTIFLTAQQAKQLAIHRKSRGVLNSLEDRQSCFDGLSCSMHGANVSDQYRSRIHSYVFPVLNRSTQSQPTCRITGRLLYDRNRFIISHDNLAAFLRIVSVCSCLYMVVATLRRRVGSSCWTIVLHRGH